MGSFQHPLPNMDLRHIRCLLFDVGYTLWDRRRDVQAGIRAEAEANRCAGALLRHLHLSDRIARAEDAEVGALFRAAFDDNEHKVIRSNPGVEPPGPQLVQQILQQWGIETINPSDANAIFQALQIHIAAPSFLFDDVLSTLAILQARGFLLGIVTNRLWGGKTFIEDLRQLGLLTYFDLRAITISADVGIRKPHPDLFLHACKTLDIAPQEAAMVGDSLRTDILGAQQLGMFTVWKPRPKQLEQVKAHLTRVRHVQTPEGREEDSFNPAKAFDAEQSDIDTDYLPASSQGRDGYLERYLRGEIMPDLVIEHISDLLDMFAHSGY